MWNRAISKEIAVYLSLLERKMTEAGILIVSSSGHRQPH